MENGSHINENQATNQASELEKPALPIPEFAEAQKVTTERVIGCICDGGYAAYDGENRLWRHKGSKHKRTFFQKLIHTQTELISVFSTGSDILELNEHTPVASLTNVFVRNKRYAEASTAEDAKLERNLTTNP